MNEASEGGIIEEGLEEYLEEGSSEEASGRRHMEASGRHLEASGNIWKHLGGTWTYLGGSWEASGGV